MIAWLRRLGDEHFVITNRLGADRTFTVGSVHEIKSGPKAGKWKVTRVVPLRGSRWGSIYVYGKRQK